MSTLEDKFSAATWPTCGHVLEDGTCWKCKCKELEAELRECIKERDNAETTIGDAFFIITGHDAEWSNLFGYDDALAEIRDKVAERRDEIPIWIVRDPLDHCINPNAPWMLFKEPRQNELGWVLVKALSLDSRLFPDLQPGEQGKGRIVLGPKEGSHATD